MNKSLRLFSLFMLSCFAICRASVSNYVPFGTSTDKKVIISRTHVVHPHLLEPVVTYNSSASLLTINFANQPINNYIVTISTAQTNVDYYATSPYTTIPLVVDGISSYDITIETADGDVFEGTLFANDTPPSVII